MIWASAVSEDPLKHQTDCSESGPKICTCPWGEIFQFVVSQILNNLFKNILLLVCNIDNPQNSSNSTNTALQSRQNKKIIPRRFSLIWLRYSFRHEFCVQSYFKSNEDNFSILTVPVDLESDIESAFNCINGAIGAEIYCKFPKKVEISADRKVPKFITS